MYQQHFSMQESIDLGNHAKALVVFRSVEVIVFCVNGKMIFSRDSTLITSIVSPSVCPSDSIIKNLHK